MASDRNLSIAWWTPRVGLGLAPILAGLDKFFNLLTNWEMYLDAAISQLLHIPATTLMHIVGVVEIAAGILVFTRLTRYAAYVVTAWLILIAANLVAQAMFFDIAIRDIELSLAAFVLAQLTEARERSADHRTGSAETESARHLA